MEEIRTDNAPEAIGPYSQAVRSGNMVFLSGQIPIDPATGEVISGGIKEQTKRVFDNLTAVIKESGLLIDDVVKVTVYMTDLGEFALMNEVYALFFNEPYPARATVGVKELPKGVSVEVDAVLVG
ncbi:MAG: RidA family protein [Deltaproteobacteria bacterium]|nr:RidA family protein [Deltaproteobacteria bacterium]